MAPSLTDVDAAIDRAQTQVSRLGGRLFELDAECGRRAPEAGGLRGASAAVWQAAQDQIAAMWACFQALSHTVDSIVARRRAPGCDRRDLWAELTGPSVDLGKDTAEMARGYLPDGAPTVSAWAIDPLVEVMSGVLAEAAERVISVLAIREIASPRLDEIAGSLARAEAAVLAAGLRIPNELVAVEGRLGALREQLATDPMAVPPGAVAQLSADAVRIGHQVEMAAAQLDNVDEALDQIAGELHAGLEDLARARQGLAEVEAKIARPDGRPAVGSLDDLAGRLAELEGGLEEARRHAVTGDRAGAVRLAGALGPPAAQLRAATGTVAGSVTAPLARRRELRGRLDAYRAKAHSLGRAEDPELADLYDRAEATLYAAPCDLDEAERRLARYQAGILHPTQREGRA